MDSIKKGDRVSISYVGRFQGHVFATNRQQVAKGSGIYSPRKSYEPYTFTVGSGEAIKGIEEGIMGMERGEHKEITVTPEKGFGYPKKELIKKFPIKAFRQNNIEAQKGMVIVTPQATGEIIDIQKYSVIVDFNHPLSGKVLVYDLTIEHIECKNFHGQEGGFSMATLTNKASLGATVLIEDLANGNQSKYTLVGPEESEVSQGKISVDSPVGSSLIGKEVGNLITVRVPGGIREFEILKITYE